MVASYTFQDLSGSSIPVSGDNPYQDLISACNDDPLQIQTRYKNQLINRNTQKRAELLSPHFPGVTIDPILARLEDPTIEPGYKDPRHCLVFWARPTEAVKTLISRIQQQLLEVCPHLWIMPRENLHMTALEVAHSLTAEQIDSLVAQIEPHVQEITNYIHDHHAPRLVRPHLNYDTASLALQFLPAVGEAESSTRRDDSYTYHHLRRDLFSRIKAAGVEVGSRYVTPSAHLTICRFVTTRDFEMEEGRVDRARVEKFVRRIDEVNAWLQREYWPMEDGVKEGGEWLVGQEKGLECRRGTLWYGGGSRVYIGKGI